MATRQQDSDLDTGEVIARLDERPRIIQDYGGGSSLYANVSDVGREVHRLEKGSTVEITVCERGIWIAPKNA